MISWYLKALMRVAANSLTAGGRRRNHRVAADWPWLVASRRAREAGRDLMCQTHNGMTLYVSPRDAAVGKTVFLNGCFEPAEARFIERFVLPGMTVVDIGANVGAHTLLLARCVEASGAVHAFEPSAAAEYLARNIAANGLGQVILNRTAIGAEGGSLRLTRCKPGMEAFTSLGAPMVAGAADGHMDVAADTLDSYSSRHALRHIDLVKMDVEGAEVLVLKGAADLLRTRQVAAWLFEANSTCLGSLGFEVAQLTERLTQAGYRLFLVDDDGWMTGFSLEGIRRNRDVLALLPCVIDEMQAQDGRWGQTFACAIAAIASPTLTQ